MISWGQEVRDERSEYDESEDEERKQELKELKESDGVAPTVLLNGSKLAEGEVVKSGRTDKC